MLRVLIWLLFGVLAACADPEIEPVTDSLVLGKPTHYFADRAYIRDTQGRAVLLRGINWSGGWKKFEIYGTDATEGDVQEIAALGLNSVRMLTNWNAIMPEDGKIDEAYLADFRRRVELAQKYDLLIVVDMHQDIYGYGVKQNGWPIGNGAPAWSCTVNVAPIEPWFFYYIQNGVAECYDKFYTDPYLIRRFAEAFEALIGAVGGNPNVVGFELLNEPFWGTYDPLTFDAHILVPFYEKVIEKISDDIGDRIIFMEPAAVRNGLATSFSLTHLPYENAVYAPHMYYQPMENGEPFDGNTAFLDYRFAMDRRESDMLGAPLWLGEWGNAAAGPEAAVYINEFANRADNFFIGWAYWDFTHIHRHDAPSGGSYVSQSLSRPYVERAPGKPTFSYDLNARTLKLTIQGDGASETWVRGPKGWSAEFSLSGDWMGKAAIERTEPYLRIVLPPVVSKGVAEATITFNPAP